MMKPRNAIIARLGVFISVVVLTAPVVAQTSGERPLIGQLGNGHLSDEERAGISTDDTRSTVDVKIWFAPGSAGLSEDSLEVLNRLARGVSEWKSERKNRELALVIVRYTGAGGRSRQPALAIRRAAAIRRFLSSRYQIDLADFPLARRPESPDAVRIVSLERHGTAE